MNRNRNSLLLPRPNDQSGNAPVIRPNDDEWNSLDNKFFG